MRSSGFEVSRSEYIHRQTVNKKEGLEVPRTFVQGKYVKPTGSSLQSTQSTGKDEARDNMAQTLENETTGTSLQSTKSAGNKAASDKIAKTNFENKTTDQKITQSAEKEMMKGEMTQTAENETSRDECIDCDRLRQVEKSCQNTDGKKNCSAEVPNNMYANGDNIAAETAICSEDKNYVTKNGDYFCEFDKFVQENFETPIHERVKPNESEAEILCEKYETDDISKISILSMKNSCDLNERKVASGCDSMQDDS